MNQKAIDSFERAANAYHQSSGLQRQIAANLIDMICGTGVHPETILEIGCGTGNLTRLLIESWPDSERLVTDASSAMLEKCRSTIEAQSGTRFERLIAGNDCVEGRYDLIVSNMTLQWLDDLNGTLTTLLAHCERLAFTIPVDGSFSQWIAAHESAGLEPGIRDLIAESRLKEELDQLENVDAQLSVIEFGVFFQSPIEFVRSLRETGTSTPRDNHKPVNLRRVFAGLPDGVHANYRIAFIILETTEV